MKKYNKAINVLINEEVMNLPCPSKITHESGHIDPIYECGWMCYPEYEEGDVCKWEPLNYTDNSAFWLKVIDKMAELGYGLNIHATNTAEFTVTFSKNSNNWIESGSTIGLAVCKAALYAIREEK